MVNYQHESYCVYLVVYHIIWCQIRWRKVLVAPIHDRLQEIIEQVIEENAWKLLKLAIQPDHVHLFVRANPYTRPSDIARKIKGRSSHLLREAFPQFGTDTIVMDTQDVLLHRGRCQQ